MQRGQKTLGGLAAAAAAPRVSATPAGRHVLKLNQGWDFYRPPEPEPFAPPLALLVAQGEFPPGTAAQEVHFQEQKACYICLESRSAHQGPSASVSDLHVLDADHQPVPRDGWSISYVDREEAAAGGAAVGALDGKPDTAWLAAGRGGNARHPHFLVINLGAVRRFSGFRYLPRQDGNPTGTIKTWRFYASEPPFPLPPAADTGEPAGTSTWESVNLPHTVRLEPLNASGCRNYQGVSWYRKTLAIDGSFQNRTTWLRFEGAMQVADVWLNGKQLTTHYGGYLPFTLDLTDHLKFGAHNTLLVRLDNSDNPELPPGCPQTRLDFTYFGGLYRNVWLEVLDRLHITDEILADTVAGGGVFVRYPAVSAEQARIEVQTDVVNQHAAARTFALRQELVDAAGSSVVSAVPDAMLEAGARKAFRQSLTVSRPRLWHPHHPNLYTLRTSLLVGGKVVDDRSTRIGIRRLEFTPEGMFVNGDKFFALGFNRHQDHPYVGYALPDSQQYRDAKKLRDAGFTSFRGHYPQAPAFMDACDELGIVCIVSNPGWQFFGNRTFVERTYQGAREMVRRDRNHACAILWEAQLNETAQVTEEYCRKLNAIVHQEYPGDQCFTAGDPAYGNEGGKVFDVAYGRERVPGRPTWAREWGDSVDNWTDQQSRIRTPRGWGELPLLAAALNRAVKLNHLFVKTGDPASTCLCGCGVWAGVEHYRGAHPLPHHSPPLDLFRLPKFDYYLFQSQRPPDVMVDGVSSGPMVFIANYATAFSPATIVVFSNCEEVRLFENGAVVATQKPDSGYLLAHPPFTFQARKMGTEQVLFNVVRAGADDFFEPSELQAEGLIGGAVVATHEVVAPGIPRRIDLKADYDGRPLVADGADWIRVYAHLVDDRGTVNPFATDLVTFSVEGEGCIIGDAAIGANPVSAEAGIATALLRATTTAGKILVGASAWGLVPGAVTIESGLAVAAQRSQETT